MIEAKKKIDEWCEKLSGKVSEAAVTGGIAEKISELANDARNQELVVPVVGLFSAGKSTMINSILGEDILPVDIKPETTLATELHYSHENFIEAINKNGEIDRYQVDELGNKVKANASQYEYTRLYLDNKALREIEPFVMVDMPGFDSPLEIHAKAITTYLYRGCYYIVLSSIEDGTMKSSLEKRLYEIEKHDRDFSFFLSKVDKKPKDEVPEILNYYQDQITSKFLSKTKVIPLEGTSSDEVMKCIKGININEIFQKLFRSRLLIICSDIIESINLQIKASKKSVEDISAVIKEMEDGIKELEKKASNESEDARRRYSGTLINDVVSDVGRALDNSLEELVGIAITGNTDNLERHLHEIIRSTLTVSMREKLGATGKQIAFDFSESLRGLDRKMKDLDFDENYVNNMTEKFGNILFEFDRLISDPADTGKESPFNKNAINMGFKVLAGAGLSTTVINPVIGILIIILPEIIGTFMKLFGGDPKQKQKETIRNKLLGEVFPSIKRGLRAKIPESLDDNISAIIKMIGERYKEQIKGHEEMINAKKAQEHLSKDDTEKKQKLLEDLRLDIKNIDGEIRAWGK
jgi:GTPase SAR1 family protein